MKQKSIQVISTVLLLISLLISCTKKDIPVPVNPGPVNNPPQQGGGGNDQTENMNIKVQAVIKIGDIIYDNIPATFTLTSYDSNMQAHILSVRLKPGVNDITVPSNHIRYRLFVKQWNHTDEMTLERSHLDEHTIYTLGGSREAKKLKYELSAVLVNGGYRPESKTEYQYNAQGKLVKVLLFKKRTNGEIFVSATEDLTYENEKVTVMRRKDEVGNETSKIVISYDQQGKIKSLKQVRAGEESIGTVSHKIISVGVETYLKYVHNNGTSEYYILSDKGNQTKRSFVSANGISEWSDYGYDTNINPYIHLNRPDMQLLHNSKNNVSWTGKEYYSGNLTLDPVNYNYTYDSEGYPISLVKEFRSAQTGSILNITKTTYHY